MKTAYFNDLHDRQDTKWREKLSVVDNIFPSWRLFYKSPLPKRSDDLQWRILHCVLATNVFVSKFNSNVLPFCHFCNGHDTVFHVFNECPRLEPLFALLEGILIGLDFVFNKMIFIYGYKYSKANKERCTFANFIIGQAKLAIWKTCRLAIEGRIVNVLKMFKALVESRIRVEYIFFKTADNMVEFTFKWCANSGLFVVGDDDSLIFNW